MGLNYRTKTVLGFALALAILLGVGVSSYRRALLSDQEATTVTRTHVVLEILESLRLHLADAELNRRGYLLTHRAEFVESFQRAHDRLSDALKGLRGLISDNAPQQRRLDSLEQALSLRMSYLQNSITLFQQQRGSKAAQEDLTLKGVQVMAQIRPQITAMEEQEQMLLEKRSQAEQQAFRESRWIILLGTALALALLAASSLLYWREMNRGLEAERRFHRLLEAAPDAFVVADSQGRIVIVNQQVEILFGYSRSDLLGKTVEMLMPDRFRQIHPKHRQNFHSAPSARPMGTGMTLFGLRRDGSEFPVEISLSPLEAEEGILVVSAIRDVTDRIKTQEDLRQRTEELEATNRELEAFTYSVSHDLRAPLRHIDGFSRILMDEYAGELPQQAHGHLRRIREATSHMGNLVDDLLNLSRIGRQPLALQKTNLNALVAKIKTDFSSEIAERQVDWHIALLPTVECDPGLIKQVFFNLMANAVKFTRPQQGARIEIGLADGDRQPAIFVRDNGVGFDMKYADKLFGVFQRLHRQEDFEGTGVGLATVERILRKHGGRIWVQAEPGSGATFYFTLPSLTYSQGKAAEAVGAQV
ncbi:MAG TPA: PAS domain S-box protein [Candidatus Acidoferrales bacterium]|nr:PAS domain S-box protein [Candidatus Acidoferrales bacterium]